MAGESLDELWGKHRPGTAKLHKGEWYCQGHVPPAKAGRVVGFLLSFRCCCMLSEV